MIMMMMSNMIVVTILTGQLQRLDEDYANGNYDNWDDEGGVRECGA